MTPKIFNKTLILMKNVLFKKTEKLLKDFAMTSLTRVDGNILNDRDN